MNKGLFNRMVILNFFATSLIALATGHDYENEEE